MPSLDEIGRVILEKNMKTWKVYHNGDNDDNDYDHDCDNVNDDNVNDDGQRTNCDQKLSLEPSVPVS